MRGKKVISNGFERGNQLRRWDVGVNIMKARGERESER